MSSWLNYSRSSHQKRMKNKRKTQGILLSSEVVLWIQHQTVFQRQTWGAICMNISLRTRIQLVQLIPLRLPGEHPRRPRQWHQQEHTKLCKVQEKTCANLWRLWRGTCGSKKDAKSLTNWIHCQLCCQVSAICSTDSVGECFTNCTVLPKIEKQGQRQYCPRQLTNSITKNDHHGSQNWQQTVQARTGEKEAYSLGKGY